MALKAILLRRKIDVKQSQLEELRKKMEGYQKREDELEGAVSEVDETDPDAETTLAELEDEVNKLKADMDELKTQIETLQNEVKDLEGQLSKEEEEQPSGGQSEDGSDNGGSEAASARSAYYPIERGVRKMYKIRDVVNSWGAAQRKAFTEDAGVSTFLTGVRTCMREHRAVNNVGLTIPDNMLALIREAIPYQSKIISRVDLRPIRGTARQNIAGSIEEAVWTEACANLNEVNLTFNQVEADGYKVGAYMIMCNAVLEDSDLDLAAEIMDALARGLALALDKAIIYGTGKKMPTGIVTRLAQTGKPATWGANAPEWVNLSTTNIHKIENKHGLELFQQIVLQSCLDHTYTNGEKCWLMNERTLNTLTAEAMSINASGAIVSAMNSTMPVVGGDVIKVDFIPDGDIVFGSFDLYLLVERHGAQFASSTDVRFLEDQTAFKATARYDGMPLFGESFGLLNINGQEPTKTAKFSPDRANPVLKSLTVTSGALKPAFDPKVTEYTINQTSTQTCTVTATAENDGKVVVYNGVKPCASAEEFNLATGDNVITIVVSEVGRSKSYTVKVKYQAAV